MSSDNKEGVEGYGIIITKCVWLAAIPAVTMLLGGLTVLSPKAPPQHFVYAMQHFAAGMLLCSIAQELVPSLAKAKDVPSTVGLCIGFGLGVVLMICLEAFIGDHDKDHEDEGDKGRAPGTEMLLDPEEAYDTNTGAVTLPFQHRT